MLMSPVGPRPQKNCVGDAQAKEEEEEEEERRRMKKRKNNNNPENYRPDFSPHH
jgi:hypothetical protein